MTWLRTLMLLCLIVWIGGIVFCAFVLAPTVFAVLPNQHLAANVVSPSLSKLHWIGIVSAVSFVISSLLYDRRKFARFRLFLLSNTLVFLMLAFTLASEFGITPQMRRLRAHMEISDLPVPISVQRSEFDRLHAWSTRLEGGVFLMGLVVVVLTARRFGN